MQHDIGAARQPSPAAFDIIKRWEGIEDGDPTTVELDPYMDPAGIWTIGWGHVVRDRMNMPIVGLENKSKAFGRYPGGITMQRAEAMLQVDAQDAASGVSRLVTVPLTQSQFDALVSFTFNVGVGALARSKLLAVLNVGRYADVPFQMKRWVYAGGAKLRGLINRREDEARLWARG